MHRLLLLLSLSLFRPAAVTSAALLQTMPAARSDQTTTAERLEPFNLTGPGLHGLPELDLPECAIACVTSIVLNVTCPSIDSVAAGANRDCLCSAFLPLSNAGSCLAAACHGQLLDIFIAKHQIALACRKEYPDRSNRLKILVSVMGSFTFVLIAARFCERAQGRWVDRVDDWVMAGCTLVLIPFMVLNLLLIREGFGTTINLIPPKKITLILGYIYGLEILFSLCLAVIKMSILCFYLRVFENCTFARLRLLVHIALALDVIGYLVLVLFNALQCHPVPYNWLWADPEVDHTGAQCINLRAFAYAHWGFTLSLDVILILLPLPDLWKLRLPTGEKIWVLLMFTVGGFSTFVSIPRMLTIEIVGNSMDFTYDWSLVSQWSALEVFSGVICACLPRVGILVTRIFPGIIGRGQYTNHDRHRPRGSPPTPRLESIQFDTIDRKPSDGVDHSASSSGGGRTEDQAEDRAEGRRLGRMTIE